MSTIMKMFFAYGVMIVVSMIVALLIKFMTSMLSSLQKPKIIVEIPLKKEEFSPIVASDNSAIAAIAASVYATLGEATRIVSIEEIPHFLWKVSNRLVYQTPHIVTQRPFQKVKK